MSDSNSTAPVNQNQNPVEYRSIEGFPSYRVGSDGSVWSCFVRKNGQSRAPGDTWRRIKPIVQKNGRFHINLSRDGKMHQKLLHRLVLSAFCGPCPDGMVCCHLDGNPQNNFVSNLCWGTCKQNQSHRVLHGTDSRGSKCKTSKLKESDVLSIKTMIANGGTDAEIGLQFGVSRDAIYKIRSKANWKHIQ